MPYMTVRSFASVLISLLIGLVSIYRSYGFNPCLIDPSACVPIEDFDVNCSCFLIVDEPINATDDVFLYFMGHQIPFYLFRQFEMPSVFRKKLDLRIPKKHDYQLSSIDMPETIYRKMHFEENMALFVINSSLTDRITRQLVNESFLRTPDMIAHSDKWCSEGECNAFAHSTVTHNRTIGRTIQSHEFGVYSHAADLLQVIEYRGQSIIAVSSVFAQFSIPTVRRTMCENKCRRFYWNENILCRQECSKRLRFDQVSVVGQLKRDFENFVRASTVINIRDKYHKYLHYYQL